MLYAGDNKNFVLPVSGNYRFRGTEYKGEHWPSWLYNFGYLPGEGDVDYQKKESSRKYLLCPSDRDYVSVYVNFKTFLSYGYINYAGKTTHWWPSTGTKAPGFYSLNQVNKYAAEMLVFADNWKHPSRKTNAKVHVMQEVYNMSFGIYGAHGRALNGAFLDGSVRGAQKILALTALSTNELWLLPHPSLSTVWYYSSN